MTIISIQQRYAGHAAQVLALAANVPGGAYYTKFIIAVDEDVDVAWHVGHAHVLRESPATDQSD